MQNNKFKVPFYFSPVLIAILTVLCPLYGVPLIAAIILLVMRTKQFTMVPKSELGKLSFVDIPPAEEYRETMRLNKAAV